MSLVDMLQAAQAVWDGIGVALAVTTPIVLCGGVFHVLLTVSRDNADDADTVSTVGTT